MNKLAAHFLTGLVLTLPAALCAQAPAPRLTLSAARAMALKNRPQVLSSEANAKRAGESVTEAKSAYFPTLNGDITGAAAVENSRIGAGVINDPRLFNHAGAGMSLSQLITDFGRTPNLVAASKLNQKASEEDARATNYDVVLSVYQAYYETLLARQLVIVSQQAVQARQAVENETSALFKNQLRSEVDLSFTQVNLSDARLMLIRAQDRLNSAYANLGEALGTDRATRYRLVEPSNPPPPPHGVRSMIAEAYQNRPELASARLQTEAARHFERAEGDLKRPTVSVVGSAGVLPFIEPGNANPDIPNDYGAAALNVNIPIFNGRLFSAREKAAASKLVMSEQQTRGWKDRVAQNVRTAAAHARSTYQEIGTTAQLLKHANLALDLAQARYKMGLGSIVELTEAQFNQTRAQVESANAKYGYEEAYSALQYSIGLLH